MCNVAFDLLVKGLGNSLSAESKIEVDEDSIQFQLMDPDTYLHHLK